MFLVEEKSQMMMNKSFVKLITGIIFISIGCGLILMSLLFNVRQHLAQDKLISEFKESVSNEVSISEPTLENPAFEGDVLYNLRIPAIDSENPVREGVSKGVLADSLGHEPGTAYIGEQGNCVIAGHRNYTFGKFFNRLDEVAVGDYIYVDTRSGSYTYVVKEIKIVEPTEKSILSPTEETRLTLYTCTPIYVATHRLVIIAEPI
ncbi:sortase A [Pseudobutyrivibrio xylanivorans DSM 14809]|uniref:Sortase A n=2 Tax=Pseudobutyrivibrio xylanivorans TaxID=185007 RepID=A0A1M6A1J6_PSEXY|nr:sortase A [Pseudobutyrivibrio xylanivorans DSM 14809]